MIIERDAVRAILLTAQCEVLLLRIRPPDEVGDFWITPGGGLRPGETVEEGLGRELQEELGLENFGMGPEVWRRQHTFTWEERRICQRERYFMVHVERFDARLQDMAEARVLQGLRWWPAHELALSREPLTPLALASIVKQYIADGPPAGPLAWEVLVD